VDAGPHVLADRYELLAPLARGGMGQVWRARDRLLNRTVAVKILRSEFTDDSAFRARFRAEAQHAASLMHPNIASVFDYGEVPAGTGEPVAYLVMELVEGESLAVLQQRERRLGVARALSVLRQTAAALAAAHAAGIVHRDVKPGNVLVAPDGTVKITDFGVAWSASSVPLTGTGQVIGTAHYLSPEQAQGAKATPASDVYALGAVAYECLAGRRVFDGESSVQIALRQIRDEPDPLPADVPPDVRDLVMGTLVKDPADRYPDGAALLAAVERVVDAQRETGRTGTAVLPLPLGPGAAGLAAGTMAAGTMAAGTMAAAGADQAATVPGMVVPGAPHTDGPPRAGGHGAAIWAAVGALLVVLGVVAVVALNGSQPAADTGPTTSAPSSEPPTSTAPSTPAGVEVVAADLVGRPVDDVRAELEALGLTVQLAPVTTAEDPGGQVLAVEPAGQVPAGATVTVSYAVAPEPAPEPTPTDDGGDEGEGEDDGEDEDEDKKKKKEDRPGRGNGRGNG
jgi:serine/threonine-protein kinase